MERNMNPKEFAGKYYVCSLVSAFLGGYART